MFCYVPYVDYNPLLLTLFMSLSIANYTVFGSLYYKWTLATNDKSFVKLFNFVTPRAVYGIHYYFSQSGATVTCAITVDTHKVIMTFGVVTQPAENVHNQSNLT